LGTGSSLLKFNNPEAQGTYIDLDLKALPATIKEEDLKKVAGVK